MKSVAVIGASNDRTRFGNKAVRAFASKGWRVFPVNPNEKEVEGLPAFSGISQVPERPDWVTCYLRPALLKPLLGEIAEKGCDELWLNPGTTSDTVLGECDRLKLNAVQGCSILAIGVSPHSL
jgi:predicted CoA-binding protein